MINDHRSTEQMLREHLAVCPDFGPPDPRGQFLSTALAGEAGELENVYKKMWRDGRMADLVKKARKELVDVYIYARFLAIHMHVDLEREMRRELLAFEKRPEWAPLLEQARLRSQERGG